MKRSLWHFWRCVHCLFWACDFQAPWLVCGIDTIRKLHSDTVMKLHDPVSYPHFHLCCKHDCWLHSFILFLFCVDVQDWTPWACSAWLCLGPCSAQVNSITTSNLFCSFSHRKLAVLESSPTGYFPECWFCHLSAQHIYRTVLLACSSLFQQVSALCATSSSGSLSSGERSVCDAAGPLTEWH